MGGASGESERMSGSGGQGDDEVPRKRAKVMLLQIRKKGQ